MLGTGSAESEELDHGVDHTSIYSRFPGREEQIEALSLLFDKDIPTPPALLITGPRGSGKTTLLKSLLHANPAVRYAWLNCVERFTPRLLFESALAQLAGFQPEPLGNDCAGPWGTWARCDNVADFRARLGEVQRGWGDAGEGIKTVLVFDDCERLKTINPLLLPALLRLEDCVASNITILLISHLTWDDFRSTAGSFEPYTLAFPAYGKYDTLRILERDCPPDEELAFFTNFVELLYDMFRYPCRDLGELRYLVKVFFPKYLEPVRNGTFTREETSKLYGRFVPYFKEALEPIYLRQVSSLDQMKTSISDYTHSVILTATSRAVDLPHYTKFLAIASFLASYNPPRLDMRFFSKGGEEGRKKRGGGSVKGRVNKEGGKLRQQLLGPKAFPLERLLAIFYSIIPDDMDATVDVYMQLTTLVNLRLLIRISPPDKLDGVKCKCNMSYETVAAVARSVGFAVGMYLFDFE
ncbi:origin recognition complex subunit 5-like protein [Fimicolochytrium jonesii]|uniref:origin recognition complex subunit 5-like protein n=1 Tax=Fimicolochytrium jonesii TaxID=1396493 RepID=UPI0022FE38CB|nr:origin recognition complex subunit 5-like protein [Fimicolochytrium jonesii]KAI8822257.1 origin recognition complex subunit 5-like protein [Fimicolochytrium jonesii]